MNGANSAISLVESQKDLGLELIPKTAADRGSERRSYQTLKILREHFPIIDIDQKSKIGVGNSQPMFANSYDYFRETGENFVDASSCVIKLGFLLNLVHFNSESCNLRRISPQ